MNRSYTLKPNTAIAKIAMSILAILAILYLVKILFLYLDLQVFEQIANDEIVGMEDIDNMDSRNMLLIYATIIVFICSILSFIAWFYRAYKNLHKIKSPLGYKPGWAIGVWFVPILNLFGPYNIMQELYDEAKKFLIKKEHSYADKIKTNIIVVWWVLLLLSYVLYKVSDILYKDAVELEVIKDTNSIYMLASSFMLISALLAIKVIWDYMKAEEIILKVADETDLIRIRKIRRPKYSQDDSALDA